MNLFLVPAAHPPAEARQIYDQTYALWKSVWFETLKELDGITSLPSDGFTRQDFFAAAKVGDRIAAICFFREADLTVESHRDDSWFQPWPKELLLEISQTRRRTLIPSWLTVHREFRKSSGAAGCNWSLVMSELISLVCLDVNADVGFGTPRKDRSVNRLVAQAGAVCLKEDVHHHGVMIDLVAFYPEILRQVNYSSDTLWLWQNKIDFRTSNYKTSVQIPQDFIEKENANETNISARNGSPDRRNDSLALGK